jgi:hypothetical protein
MEGIMTTTSTSTNTGEGDNSQVLERKEAQEYMGISLKKGKIK